MCIIPAIPDPHFMLSAAVSEGSQGTASPQSSVTISFSDKILTGTYNILEMITLPAY